MDHHGFPILENDKALDFTSTTRKSTREPIVESPVLDLSCKKQNSSSCSLSPVSIEEPSSPGSIEANTRVETSSHERDNNEDRYGDTETKSPFEGRNFMVTPPSEVDSPRKPKYDVIYKKASSVTSVITSNDTSSPNRYAMMPTSLALPMVQQVAIISNLSLSQNGCGETSSTTFQLPVSTSTATTTMSHEVPSPMTSPETTKKMAPRPFKAYPKDPLSMSTVGSAELMYDQNSNEAYTEFRKRMLESVRRSNEGTNIKMRRVTKSPGLPTSTMDDKDAAYWERRRKNNEAAKRSRDARRAKEDEIAIRAAFLEQENMKLKYELVALRNETAKLRCMVYTN